MGDGDGGRAEARHGKGQIAIRRAPPPSSLGEKSPSKLACCAIGRSLVPCAKVKSLPGSDMTPWLIGWAGMGCVRFSPHPCNTHWFELVRSQNMLWRRNSGSSPVSKVRWWRDSRSSSSMQPAQNTGLCCTTYGDKLLYLEVQLTSTMCQCQCLGGDRKGKTEKEKKISNGDQSVLGNKSLSVGTMYNHSVASPPSPSILDEILSFPFFFFFLFFFLQHPANTRLKEWFTHKPTQIRKIWAG